jgi:hypothetical protein
LPIDLDRIIDPVRRVVSKGAILTDPLDVFEKSAGLKPDPPQGGKIRQPFADIEVAWVVNGGLGPPGAALLMILLDS